MRDDRRSILNLSSCFRCWHRILKGTDVFITRLIKSHQSLLGDEASYRQQWFHDDVNRDPMKTPVGAMNTFMAAEGEPPADARKLAKTISALTPVIPHSLRYTCLPRITLSTVAVHNYLTTTLFGLSRCNWRLTWTAFTVRSYIHFNIAEYLR